MIRKLTAYKSAIVRDDDRRPSEQGRHADHGGALILVSITITTVMATCATATCGCVAVTAGFGMVGWRTTTASVHRDPRGFARGKFSGNR